MWLVTERERDLIGRIGPILLRRFDELADDWAQAWREASDGSSPPVDLPGVTRVCIEQGVDSAADMQRRAAHRLAEEAVPLHEIVLAVLLWEEVVLRRLARDALQDIFAGAAALNRFHHGLVLYCAEVHAGMISVGRDEVRRGLEDADRLKTELVSMVSHDLKTPLTTIEACTDQLLAEDGIEPAQRRRFVELIAQNADRLHRLISSILDVSRLEARAVDLSPGPVDVVEVTRQIVQGLLPHDPLRLEADADLPEVVADRQALERIMLNLIDNAVRWSPSDEPVVVTVTAEGPFVEVRVIDRGPGVPPARRDGLFSKFYQVDPSHSGRRAGTGLGLAIVRGLAEAMGGSVGFRPNDPRGSVFWVRLPAASTAEVTRP